MSDFFGLKIFRQMYYFLYLINKDSDDNSVTQQSYN